MREEELKQMMKEIGNGFMYNIGYKDQFMNKMRQVYSAIKAAYQLGVKDGILMKQKYEER